MDAVPDAVAQFEWLNDSKRVTLRRRAELLPAIQELADMVAVVVISVAEINRDGVQVSNINALARALLPDWRRQLAGGPARIPTKPFWPGPPALRGSAEPRS